MVVPEAGNSQELGCDEATEQQMVRLVRGIVRQGRAAAPPLPAKKRKLSEVVQNQPVNAVVFFRSTDGWLPEI